MSETAKHRRITAAAAVPLHVAIVVLVLAVSPVRAGHDKSDVATTKDGSTYFGEIKSVQFANLNLDTDPAGLLAIEWRHVTGLISRFEYRVELTGGVVHYGSLGTPENPGHLRIVNPSGAIEVGLGEVVDISPIESGFWKSLDGAVNFGLTYLQANESLQYSLGADAERRTRKRYGSLSGQSIFSTQNDGSNTSQHSLKLILAQVAKQRWGTFEVAQLQSNPNQGYDVRSILGGGAANFLVENSGALLSLSLGVVYNREAVTDSPEVTDSGEALVAVSLYRFKRGSHSPSLKVSLMTFTNLTEGSRFRAVLNFNIAWKIIGNFKFSVQANNSYDSDPPGLDSKNNDLTLVTSLGYTF
jgi:hypothetical protein